MFGIAKLTEKHALALLLVAEGRMQTGAYSIDALSNFPQQPTKLLYLRNPGENLELAHEDIILANEICPSSRGTFKMLDYHLVNKDWEGALKLLNTVILLEEWDKAGRTEELCDTWLSLVAEFVHRSKQVDASDEALALLSRVVESHPECWEKVQVQMCGGYLRPPPKRRRTHA